MVQITELLSTLLGMYTSIILLRVWLQVARADFYNPFSQFVIKVTQPILGPLRRIIPSLKGWDTAAIVFALVISSIEALLPVFLLGHKLIISQLLIVSAIKLLISAYYLLFAVLILRAVLSWISQGNNPIEHLAIQLTEPILSPIRKIIPPIGGLDLSMIVLILGLNFMMSFIF